MSDMRFSFYLCLIIVGWAIVTLASDPLSRIVDALKDDDSIIFYANCFLDKGPCSNTDSRTMKRLLPEFIYSSCARCSENQKQMACKIIFTLQQDKFSDIWKAFNAKYDPRNDHQTSLENFQEYCREHAYV